MAVGGHEMRPRPPGRPAGRPSPASRTNPRGGRDRPAPAFLPRRLSSGAGSSFPSALGHLPRSLGSWSRPLGGGVPGSAPTGAGGGRARVPLRHGDGRGPAALLPLRLLLLGEPVRGALRAAPALPGRAAAAPRLRPGARARGARPDRTAGPTAPLGAPASSPRRGCRRAAWAHPDVRRSGLGPTRPPAGSGLPVPVSGGGGRAGAAARLARAHRRALLRFAPRFCAVEAASAPRTSSSWWKR